MKSRSSVSLTLAMAIALALNSNNVSADTPIGMTWTPGGYTATTENVPPTAANGTVISTISPTSLSATLNSNPTNNVLGALYLDGNPTGGPLFSQNIQLRYDITVNTQPASATLQPKNLDQSLNGGPALAGTAGIMLGMNIAATVPGPASPWAFRFAVAPTSLTGGVFAMRSMDNSTLMAFGNYAVGTTYSLELNANYTTGLLDAYINGNLALSGYQFATGGAGVSTSEVFIHLNGESGVGNSVTVENLIVSVPEPSAVALFALALGLAALHKKRIAGA